MSRLENYSKWDHIELSDDDAEDLPPQLDKDSFVGGDGDFLGGDGDRRRWGFFGRIGFVSGEDGRDFCVNKEIDKEIE